MSTPMDMITYNIMGMAEKFQSFFHGPSGDVKFERMHYDGTIVTSVVPNVAKYMEQVKAGADPIVYSDKNPTTDTNLSLGTVLKNITSGEIFVCIDASVNKNIWIGQLGTVIHTKTVNAVDFFKDGSIVAVYQFNGNLNDSGGIYNASSNKDSYGVGKFDQAYVISSRRNAINVPTNIANEFTDEITCSGWFSPKNKKYSEHILFNLGCCVAEVQYINNAIQVAYGKNWYWKKVGTIKEFDVFAFVAISYSRVSGRFKLYINDNLLYEGTNTTTASILGPSNKLGIGARYDNSLGYGGSYFSGLIDQVRVFKRVLTDNEVMKLYNEI